eukprot:jgi/Hompol1/6029/HPOL_002355-RA
MALLDIRNKAYEQPAHKSTTATKSQSRPLLERETVAVPVKAGSADLNVDMQQEAAQQIQVALPFSNNSSTYFPAFAIEFAPESDAKHSYDHEMELLEAYKAANPADISVIESVARVISSQSTSSKLASSASSDMSVDGKRDAVDEAWIGEEYETMDLGMDKLFKKFQKTVAKAPEQCIRFIFGESRYGIKTEPLWYKMDSVQSALSSQSAPPCSLCGGKRVFECQLMPNVLNVLPINTVACAEPVESSSTVVDKKTAVDIQKLHAGMDWGTVLIYSCERDCEAEAGADLTGETLQSFQLMSEFVAVQSE